MKSRVDFVRFDRMAILRLNTISQNKKITFHRADENIVVVEVNGKFGKATKNPDEDIPYNCSYFARLLAVYRALGLKSKEEELLSEYNELLCSTDEEILNKIAKVIEKTSSSTADREMSFALIKNIMKERKKNG